jgi:hypothetical protein
MKRLALSVFLTTVMLSGAEVTGRWSGTFAFTTDDGQKGEAPVLLILKQEGTKVTGTGGRDEADRHEVTVGKIEGDKMTLEVEAGNAPVRLEVTVTGDELTGDVSRTRGDGSKQTAKVTAKRAKP